MNPPPHWQSPYQPPSSRQPHQYRGWTLTALLLGYIFACGFSLIEIAATSGMPTNAATASSPGILGSVSVILFLAIHGCIILLDSTNFLTLFGRIRWHYLNGWQRVGLVFAYLCVFIMPIIYLVLAMQHFLRARQQTLGQAVRVWYRRKTQRAQITIGVVSVLLLMSCVAFTSVAAIIDRGNALMVPTPITTVSQSIRTTQSATATPTQPVVLQVTVTPTPKLKPTATPTPRPTPKPTQLPPKPQPTPTPCGNPCNPFGYTFTPGNLIYYPPSGFCNYFSCIPSFYEKDDPGDGYIVECNDGTYSQSGGERGACSYHGGVLRSLYSH
jgi:hypothetical protein